MTFFQIVLSNSRNYKQSSLMTSYLGTLLTLDTTQLHVCMNERYMLCNFSLIIQLQIGIEVF